MEERESVKRNIQHTRGSVLNLTSETCSGWLEGTRTKITDIWGVGNKGSHS